MRKGLVPQGHLIEAQYEVLEGPVRSAGSRGEYRYGISSSRYHAKYKMVGP